MRQNRPHFVHGFRSNGGLFQGEILDGSCIPLSKILVHFEFLLLDKQQRLANADRRKKPAVSRIAQGLIHLGGELIGLAGTSQPDVRVQQQSHFCSLPGSRAASQSEISLIGPTISPLMVMDAAPVPNLICFVGWSAGGLIRATGRPKGVTRIGLPIFRPRSRTAKQVALNFGDSNLIHKQLLNALRLVVSL
jgi:hypothetical protein